MRKIVTVLCPQSLHCSVANGGGGLGVGVGAGRNSGLQFSRLSPNFIDPIFLHVCKHVSLISFPNAWIISQTQRICLPSLCSNLVSHYVHEKWTFSVFSAFASGSSSVQATKKNHLFLCIVFQHLSTEMTSKQQPQSSRKSSATHVLSQSHNDLHVYDFVLLLQD